MTLTSLVISVAIAALVLTGLGIGMGRVKNWVVSYLQNFTGALFVFSGWVKAIDPLGTAYKMEQYFAEFEATFSGTWFSFMAGWFPVLSEQAVSFAVFMIVFEIVLGIMLLIGSWPRFTGISFFLLVFFFTFLTGFTYLTGYVPEGVNFFEFGNWGPYVKTNMKVTDCGCFGDFLKLEPKVSFMKDVVLLVPSVVFLIFPKQMHQLFNSGVRKGLVWLGIVGISLYCFSNYVWDLPHTDFRPFKKTANIRIQQGVERTAKNNVKVEFYSLTNKASGVEQVLTLSDYLKQYKNFPKEEWVIKQLKSDPKITLVQNENLPGGYDLLEINGEDEMEVEMVAYLKDKWKVSGDTLIRKVEDSKVTDFDISDTNGNNVTEAILGDPNYSFMIISYKLYGKTERVPGIQIDSLFQIDTIQRPDTVLLERTFAGLDSTEITEEVYHWDEDFAEVWQDVVNPVLDQANASGMNVFAITAFNDVSAIEDFRHRIDASYPVYLADDILLKTIVRSNPGVVLLKNGEVVMKWHYKKLPDFENIEAAYLK